jgi:hypothetical protein
MTNNLPTLSPQYDSLIVIISVSSCYEGPKNLRLILLDQQVNLMQMCGYKSLEKSEIVVDLLDSFTNITEVLRGL